MESWKKKIKKTNYRWWITKKYWKRLEEWWDGLNLALKVAINDCELYFKKKKKKKKRNDCEWEEESTIEKNIIL